MIQSHLNKYFIPKYKIKWKDADRKKHLFISKNSEFYKKNEKITLLGEESSSQETLDSSCQLDMSSKPPAVGRPRSSYEEGCSRTKRRYASKLSSEHSKEELSLALKLKDSFDDGNETSTDHVNKILAMYMDLDLTKRKYEKMRIHNLNLHGNKLYPPYSVIVSAMKNCYPEHITFSNKGAKINFIALLEHTLKRILMTLDEKRINDCKKSLIFMGKWGMDGASGQQTTRQIWKSIDRDSSSSEDSENEVIPSDEAVYICNFVPIEVKTVDDEILWINEKPSSVFYTRPISFKFTKETNEMTTDAYRKLSKLISQIETYEFKFLNNLFDVKFDLKCTMIDGKTCNVLTEQDASNCCNICGVNPSKVNDLQYVSHLNCNENNYDFGFSVLHCWIRFMEYILHISYNLDFQKSQARGTNKELKMERKHAIQKLLRKKCGLLVDVVKQGAGTTNTGNVARSFFFQRQKVSEIIGINENLLTRLYVVLQIISTTSPININTFEKYCLETARECVKLYPWYYMPPSVHKVLIHGCNIMRKFNKPIGYFSEEAQETNNKIFRRARAFHSRMCDRRATNEDIMHYCMILSDPVISSLRYQETKKPIELTPEAKQFIKK